MIDLPTISSDLNMIKTFVKEWDFSKTRNKENLKDHIMNS